MAEEMNMDEMGERPPMPEMDGANMVRQMPQEARARLMQPSEEIGAVLVARIANMEREELRMLDKAITPDVARVLVKLLPELQEIIPQTCLLYTSPSPRDGLLSRMPSSA